MIIVPDAGWVEGVAGLPPEKPRFCSVICAFLASEAIAIGQLAFERAIRYTLEDFEMMLCAGRLGRYCYEELLRSFFYFGTAFSRVT